MRSLIGAHPRVLTLIVSSGPHNMAPIPRTACCKDLSTISFGNARALRYGRTKSRFRRRKLRELTALCQNSSIVCACEVSGTTTHVEQAIGIFVRTHFIFHSPFTANDVVVPGIRGVCILVLRSLLSDRTDSLSFSRNVPRSIVPGRVARVVPPVNYNGQSFARMVVRNERLSAA